MNEGQALTGAQPLSLVLHPFGMPVRSFSAGANYQFNRGALKLLLLFFDCFIELA